MLLCGYRLKMHTFLFQRAGCHLWTALGTFLLYSMFHDWVSKLRKHVLKVTWQKKMPNNL
jgi:hypothetical protein